MRSPIGVALLSMIVAAGCARTQDVGNVPVGSEVQLTRKDGGVVEGVLTERNDKAVRVDVGRTTREVARQDVAEVRVVDPSTAPPELPAIARFREVTIPRGTVLAIRLEEPLSSARNKEGDPVRARITDAVMVDGYEALPSGSPVRAVVATAVPAGKVKGRASLALTFVNVSAHGEEHALGARFSMVAPATKKEDAAKIGLPAAGGAVIGAIVGGKKGAAIGAAAGGGAGTAAVLMTSGDEVEIATGTELQVTTTQAIDVKIPVQRAKRE